VGTPAHPRYAKQGALGGLDKLNGSKKSDLSFYPEYPVRIFEEINHVRPISTCTCPLPPRPGGHAAALYAGEHDLMWKVWDLAGGNGNPQAHTFMPDPAIRRQMADLVLQARQKDVEAANCIEQALAKDTGK